MSWRGRPSTSCALKTRTARWFPFGICARNIGGERLRNRMFTIDHRSARVHMAATWRYIENSKSRKWRRRRRRGTLMEFAVASWNTSAIFFISLREENSFPLSGHWPQNKTKVTIVWISCERRGLRASEWKNCVRPGGLFHEERADLSEEDPFHSQ